MTLPHERSLAVQGTRHLLLSLARAYGPDSLKRIPKAVREEARRLLRHFPSALDMAKAADAMPELFSKRPEFTQWEP